MLVTMEQQFISADFFRARAFASGVGADGCVCCARGRKQRQRQRQRMPRYEHGWRRCEFSCLHDKLVCPAAALTRGSVSCVRARSDAEDEWEVRSDISSVDAERYLSGGGGGAATSTAASGGSSGGSGTDAAHDAERAAAIAASGLDPRLYRMGYLWKRAHGAVVAGAAGAATSASAASHLGWSRRFFVLNERSAKLYYFGRPEERTARGVVDLADCRLVDSEGAFHALLHHGAARRTCLRVSRQLANATRAQAHSYTCTFLYMREEACLC
jgi:hypothetical protein